MRFSLPVMALAAALFAAAFGAGQLLGAASAQQESVTVNLGPATGPDGGGDQSGTATLTAVDGQTEVVIDVEPSPDGADVEQPAHIHTGNCDSLPDSLGAIAYPLENVVNGSSTTTVDASLEALQSVDYAINVHESGEAVGVYVSCGNIPAAEATTDTTTDTTTGTTDTTADDASGLPVSGGAPPSDGGLSLATYLLVAGIAVSLIGGGSLALSRLRR